MTEADMAALYTQYGYTLYRRCLAFLGEPAAAQDAVQEVFVRALRAYDRFEDRASPRTWLCRIADHLCVDLLRRRRRNPVRLMEVAADGSERDQDRAVAAVLMDDPTRFLMVCSMMERLDESSRRLAVLYFLDELTQEELASELGVSRRTIGKRIQSLLARARLLLDAEVES
jgi:RNA polymerase sigma-70 factor (ECF subfamily)